MSRSFLRVLVLVALAHAGRVPTVSAQSAAARVQQLTTDAMNAFHELDLERADALLEQARSASERESVDPATAARVHLSLGVLAVSGHGDTQRAQQCFMRALELDPTVEPDPMTSTPEVTSSFQIAKARRASASRAPARTNPPAVPAAPPSVSPVAASPVAAPPVAAPPVVAPAPVPRPVPAAVPTPPSSPTPAPAAQTMPPARPSRYPSVRHTPPLEALSNTPLPLYLEVDNAPDLNRVVVMYRGHGMRRYMPTRLTAMGAGFGAELPCAHAVAGDFVYYVVVYDSEAHVIAGSGSDSLPHRVRIVDRLSGRAPSLPGRPAPGVCAPSTSPALAPSAAPSPSAAVPSAPPATREPAAEPARR